MRCCTARAGEIEACGRGMHRTVAARQAVGWPKPVLRDDPHGMACGLNLREIKHF